MNNRANTKPIDDLKLVAEKRPKLLAVSLDFDNALAYNLEKLRTLKTPAEKIQQIIEDNKKLITAIATKVVNEGYDKVAILIGTNRQSWFADFFCGFIHESTQGSGSCFNVYKAIGQQLEIEINKQHGQTKVLTDYHLLADSFNKHPGGTALKKANQFNSSPENAAELFQCYANVINSKPHRKLLLADQKIELIGKTGMLLMQTPTLFDHTKISLLYTQMHRIAHCFSNHEIDFLFLDDNIPTILNSLLDCYYVHRELIPPNLNLQLFQYCRQTLDSIILDKTHAYESIAPLNNNFIDIGYKENLLLWSAITLNILKYDAPTQSYLINNKNVGQQIDNKSLKKLQKKVFKKMNFPIGEALENGTLDYRYRMEKILTFKILRQQRYLFKQIVRHPSLRGYSFLNTANTKPQSEDPLLDASQTNPIIHLTPALIP